MTPKVFGRRAKGPATTVRFATRDEAAAAEETVPQPAKPGLWARFKGWVEAKRDQVIELADRNIQQDPGGTKIYYPWGAGRPGVILENQRQETLVRRIEWVEKGLFVATPLIYVICDFAAIGFDGLAASIVKGSLFILPLLLFILFKFLYFRDYRKSNRDYIQSEKEISEEESRKLENTSSKQIVFAILFFTVIALGSILIFVISPGHFDFVFERNEVLGWAIIAVHVFGFLFGAYYVQKFARELLRRRRAETTTGPTPPTRRNRLAPGSGRPAS